MKAKSKNSDSIIMLKDLKQNMKIMAYTGFSDRYKSIDSKTCAFIRHNFNGVTALIKRKGKHKEIPVEEIRAEDTLLQLFAFPDSKKVLTKASQKLVTSLKKNGILQFEIQKAPKVSLEFQSDLQMAIDEVKKMMRVPSRKQERLQQGLTQAQHVVGNVKTEFKKRQEGCDILENMMDNARKGRLKSADIEHYVENIVKHSSEEAMSAIVNLKASDQTYSHCIDVGVLFQKIYYKSIKIHQMQSAFQTTNQALLGAFLHDFGKSQIAKEIIESPIRFDSDSHEMKMIRKHPYLGAKLLSSMDMPDGIVNMCLFHHVKLDDNINSSYPAKLKYDKANFETRLLAIADVYQALVGKRHYKRSWSPPQAMRYLYALAGIEYDEDVFNTFLSILGEYPIGSLVVLNDDTMGFVMSVPEDNEDLQKPMVAVVRNSDGEDYDKHQLVDLQEEKNLYIKNDLDAMDVFDQQALKKFSELQLVA